jgi:PadR family transcriptional regulator, regulatory protein PadR
MMNMWAAASRIFRSAPKVPLGSKETHAIVAVSKLGNNVDAMSAFDEARKISPTVSFGSIYTALERMTWKGYLESEWGEPEPERGGRPRKYYRVTDLGEDALRETEVAIATARPLTSRGRRKLQEAQAAIASLRQ